MLSLLSLILLIPAVLCQSGNLELKIVDEIPTELNPAFCCLVQNTSPTRTGFPAYDLMISNFHPKPSKEDAITRIENVGKFAVGDQPTSLVDKIDWPNEISTVPESIFDSPYVVVASTGFFVPGKNDGSLALLDMSNLNSTGYAEPIIISSNPTGIKWYYHRVEWHDMNGDGHLDAVTERANGGGPSADITQLVWFENPGKKEFPGSGDSWALHVIKENQEDVHFRIHSLPFNGGQTTAIISSCFYSNELTVVWSTTNDFTDASSVRTIVVDDYGWYFDVEVVDVNNDGVLDILTSTWSQQRKPGAVIAYEIPAGDSWATEAWPRHILQDNYHESILPGAGSPGAAFSFHPTTDMVDVTKPYIMVSGDDDGQAYVLKADSEDVADWMYTQSTIYKGTGTIGGIAVKDVDGDGFADIFIPAFSEGKIVKMKYALV